VDISQKTTKCPFCGRILQLKKMRRYGSAGSPEELVNVIGALNRERSNIHMSVEDIKTFEITENGKMEEATEGCGEDSSIEPRDISHKEQSSSGTSHQGDRISRIREGLRRLNEFDVQEFTSLFVECGGQREKAADLLNIMLESGEVYCPRRGVFSYLD